MSRHTFNGNQPNLRIVLGWDRQLSTYFAQVWDGGALESGNLLLWTGTRHEEVPTLDGLAALVAPFGGIPDDVRSALELEEDFDCWSLHSKL